MNIKSILIYLLIPFFLYGCLLSGPDSSRINENDPESPFFKPKLSELKSSVSSTEKLITLNWKNESKFNDGFFIEKKISSNNSYKIMDTSKVAVYSESLSTYSIDMKYRVTTFYIDEGVTKRGMKLETDSLDFGELLNFGYFSSDDTVFVQWFRGTSFDDITTIEYKPTNATELNTALTVEQEKISSDFYRTYFILERGESYNLRIRAFLIDHKEELKNFYTSSSFTFSHN